MRKKSLQLRCIVRVRSKQMGAIIKQSRLQTWKHFHILWHVAHLFCTCLGRREESPEFWPYGISHWELQYYGQKGLCFQLRKHDCTVYTVCTGFGGSKIIVFSKKVASLFLKRRRRHQYSIITIIQALEERKFHIYKEKTSKKVWNESKKYPLITKSKHSRKRKNGSPISVLLRLRWCLKFRIYTELKKYTTRVQQHPDTVLDVTHSNYKNFKI